MRHQTRLGCVLSRSLLGSALLTWAILSLSFSPSDHGHGVEASTNNNAPPYWKRTPQAPTQQQRHPHSPYTSNNPPVNGGQLEDDAPAGPGPIRRRRSLFSHVNDDIVAEQVVMVQKIKKTSQPQEPRKQTEHHVKEQQSKSAVPVIPIATPSAASIPGKNHRVSLTDKQGFVGTKREPKKSSDKIEFAPVEERIDLWGEDEDEEENQTINEGDYPSSTLFDEVDDTELFELGEDGILREIPSSHDRDQGRRSRHRSQPYDDQVYMDDEDEDNDQEEEERHDQVWMVDEWEEELEGDMDEVMNWAEEDGILNSRLQELRKVKNKKPPSAMIMGADHLRDQDSSAIRNALMDEDEASPFRHLLSDSWLF